ncbi:hypothetical protein RB195_017776 [Necator americanus]
MGLEQQCVGETSLPLAYVARATLLTPEERHKRTLKPQLDYGLARSIPQSDVRKSKADWNVASDSNYLLVVDSVIVIVVSRRKNLRRQLQQDRESGWSLRAEEFEEAFEEKNPKKAHTLLRQHSGN